ncbi:transglutaminase domain-containing protein, partial [Aquidulcibacter sp.]|uniref:transglutaminase domain-containing protein n=1 Tax=Aquidulcibacter sp. TaxID=2052990 RepID=UPI0025C4884E
MILERHREAVDTFNARRAELKSLSRKIQDARPARSLTALGKRTATPENTASLQTAINELGRFMAAYPNQRAHSQTDPYNLPFRIANDKVRKAAETEAELNAVLSRTADATSSTIAANRTTTATTITKSSSLTQGPDAADLAETEDAQLTPAIRAKAAELNNHPLTIYNWVRNNIEYLPTYGSIQGSDLTLLSKRGNAFDTASLLIALYRAANIPARYVYGTVEISAEQAMNWVGGVTNADAAQSLLSQGGIPTTSIVSGGKIVKFRIETVWVEAWLNYYPSRGAKHKPYTNLTDAQAKGNQWVPMDASFKQYAYTQGVDLKSNVPLDVNAVFAGAEQGATVDLATGRVSTLNVTEARGVLAEYMQRMSIYLNQQLPNASLGQAFGSRAIVASEASMLAGTLPASKVTSMQRFAELPTSMRMSADLRFYGAATDAQLDSPAATASISLAKLGNKRLGVTYTPSSPADATALAAAIADAQPELPAYLIRVKPQLKLDDALITEGASALLGSSQVWEVRLNAPWRDSDFAHRFNVSAGSELVFGISGSGVAEQSLRQRFQSTNNLTSGENLHQLSLNYWYAKELLARQLARQEGVGYQFLSAFGLFSSPLSVTYAFGLPRSGAYKGREMDVSHLYFAATAASSEKRATYARSVSTQSSHLEGAVPEILFGHPTGSGISTIRILQAASDEGIPVHIITSANAVAALPLLQIDSDTRQIVQNAINAGKTVIIPQRSPQELKYNGTGLIVEDPVDGTGAYLLSGGLNGGALGDCACERKKQPKVQALYEIIVTLAILAAIAAL